MRKKPLKNLMFVFVGVVVAGFICCPVFAIEQYPNRPIQLIVPYAPGGGADLGARLIADRMAEFLGQPLVSVYKAGGGGTLGASYVKGQKTRWVYHYGRE